jgi:hypothetical protein
MLWAEAVTTAVVRLFSYPFVEFGGKTSHAALAQRRA